MARCKRKCIVMQLTIVVMYKVIIAIKVRKIWKHHRGQIQLALITQLD